MKWLLLLLLALPAVAQEVTITAVGDVYPVVGPSPCAGVNLSADVVFGNLETPLLSDGPPAAGQVIHHRAPPEMASQLPFTLMSVANNHMMDYGRTGVASTVAALSNAGVAPVGVAGHESVTLERDGLRITFLAFSGGYPLTGRDFPVCRTDSEVMQERVRFYHTRGDTVVVSLHWGEEGSDRPQDGQIEEAHRLIDAGATLILGSHPHVVQGVEAYGNGLIAYSLGNFVWPSSSQESIALHVTLNAAGVKSWSATPVRLVKGQPFEGGNLRRLTILGRELGSTESSGPQTELELRDGVRAVLQDGRVWLLERGQVVWQSPASRYVTQALRDPNGQLLMLLETLTSEKRWDEDHFVLARGERELTQHLCIVGVRGTSPAWRTLWLSSPLGLPIGALAFKGKLLEADGILYEWTGWAFREYEDPRFIEQRRAMVRDILIPSGVSDPDVLEAAGRIPRQYFVPEAVRSLAYENRILPMAGGQTVPQPTLMGRMAQALELSGNERVLEIGTGSGYQSALLACIAKEVYTVEIVPELGALAQKAWRRVGLENIHLRLGDGAQGWPNEAPFDVILVTAAPRRVPVALVEQLAEGGRMLIPLGVPERPKTLWRVRKLQGKLRWENLGQAIVVPMELTDPDGRFLSAPGSAPK